MRPLAGANTGKYKPLQTNSGQSGDVNTFPNLPNEDAGGLTRKMYELVN